jgi:pre-mRNA-splicing factor SYF1
LKIWDGYAKFEDNLLAAQMENMKDNEQEEDEEEMLDFELRTARYENLIDRQPLLVNSVLLRQVRPTHIR